MSQTCVASGHSGEEIVEIFYVKVWKRQPNKNLGLKSSQKKKQYTIRQMEGL